ncbi:hypothetical protein [Marinilactibacillus kalidii]|uniref:hypothetical protein n=1 Tax=Marinilactibacillus kalidii TaxID=2820274 RepID=UPI001ABE77B2|nr:hypothetical protein [Marinilactibacillus kalidii]
MKTYLLFELKLFLKEAKNRIMFLIFSAFLLFVYFLLVVQGAGNVEQEQAEEMNASRVAISSIAAANVENEEKAELYENIYKQQQLRTQQSNVIRFEEHDWYLDSTIELAQLQIDLHTYDAFNDLDEALKNLIPSVHEARTDLARFTYMRDKDIPIMYDQKNVAGFMMLYLNTFGVAAFVFLLLYNGSLLTNDLDHQTMVKGYPVIYRQKIISKLIIYVSASFLSIFLLTGFAVVLVWVLHGSGELAYPMIVYDQHAYYALPITKYMFIYFG